MKRNLIKFYIVAIYLCSTAVMIAQGPSDGSGEGVEGGGDGTGAPIGDYIWVLALAVIVFAFWKIRAMQNAKIQD